MDEEKIIFKREENGSSYSISVKDAVIKGKSIYTGEEITSVIPLNIIRKGSVGNGEIYINKMDKRIYKMLKTVPYDQITADSYKGLNEKDLEIIVVHTNDETTGYHGMFHFSKEEYPALFINVLKDSERSRAEHLKKPTNFMIELGDTVYLNQLRTDKEKEERFQWLLSRSKSDDDCKKYIAGLLLELDKGDDVSTSRVMTLVEKPYSPITVYDVRKILVSFAETHDDFKFIRVNDIIRRIN